MTAVVQRGIVKVKIADLILEHGGSLSFEFFPPRDEAGESRLFQTMTYLAGLRPSFVSVTCGAGGGRARNNRELVLRIKNETDLIPMPHLTSIEQNRSSLGAALRDFRGKGIENILAVRGDPSNYPEELFASGGGKYYARDLVAMAAAVGGYSIGVAVYPEGHNESGGLDMDMVHTRRKVDAGADFAITQMFFDNRYYYDFLERAARAGINIPIIAGIMPITNIEKIAAFAKKCGATVPEKVVRRFDRVAGISVEMKKVGIEIATEQCADLLRNGVRNLHFYTLNQREAVTRIVTDLGMDHLGLDGEPGGNSILRRPFHPQV
jgi:methylenetetrahydrofolate reductase (NADPH)